MYVLAECLEWPEGYPCLQIAEGIDYLGSGVRRIIAESEDPRDVAAAAIAEHGRTGLPIHVGSFHMIPACEGDDITPAEATEWADGVVAAWPCCDHCGDAAPVLEWRAMEGPTEDRYCSEHCTENAFADWQRYNLPLRWYDGMNSVSWEFASLEDAESCCPAGQDATENIEGLLMQPVYSEQAEQLDPDAVRAALAEYGVWDADDLADDAANVQRLVWVAACDVTENPNEHWAMG